MKAGFPAIEGHMKKIISYLTFYSLVIAGLALPALGQSLPQGEWHLVSYNFKEKIAYPVDKSSVTLRVRPGGKLGGSSGCNVYGGNYSFENDKLRIFDVVSTMRACEEPSPSFEQSFFGTLESATEYTLKDGILSITDPATKNFLRFEQVEKKSTTK